MLIKKFPTFNSETTFSASSKDIRKDIINIIHYRPQWIKVDRQCSLESFERHFRHFSIGKLNKALHCTFKKNTNSEWQINDDKLDIW
jgi:hypothetical protein